MEELRLLVQASLWLITAFGLVMFWVVVAVVAAIVARNKGRVSLAWFIICLFYSPLMVLILLALPNLKEREATDQARLDSKTCPQCAETIRTAAKVCPHCAHEFKRLPRTPPLAAAPKAVKPMNLPSSHL